MIDYSNKGITCATQINPCSPNPCKNEGICTLTETRTILCECTATYSGPRCETPKEACGGVIRDLSGTLTYPSSGLTYGNGLSCAFILATNNSLVLNVTFTNFDLESTPGCRHDFLQVYFLNNSLLNNQFQKVLRVFCNSTYRYMMEGMLGVINLEDFVETIYH